MNRVMRGILGVTAMLVLSGCVPVTPPPAIPHPREVARPITDAEQTKVLAPTQEAIVNIELKTLRQGDQWPVRGDRRFLLITGPTAWNAFLRQQRSQPDAWPGVDWKRHVVLVALMGGKRTGGYRITIKKVQVREKTVIVHVEEVHPRPGEMVIQVLTSPFHVVALPRDVLPSPPFTLQFVTSSGVWETEISDLDEDARYEATGKSTKPMLRSNGEDEQ